MIDANFIYTICIVVLALIAAYNAKILGGALVCAIGLLIVYPAIPPALFLTGAALSVVNLVSLYRP